MIYMRRSISPRTIRSSRPVRLNRVVTGFRGGIRL